MSSRRYCVTVFNELNDCVSDLELTVYFRGDAVIGGKMGDAMLPKHVVHALIAGEGLPLEEGQEDPQAPRHTSAPHLG